MPILVPKSALDKIAADYRKREGILDEVPKDAFTAAQLAVAFGLQHAQASKIARTKFKCVGQIKQGGHWVKLYKEKP